MSHSMKKTPGAGWFVYVLVACWVVTVGLSFFLPTFIEGPRNIDTGFRRLDLFAQWQIIAFGIAIASAIAGVMSRHRRITLWIGVTPIILTVLLVGMITGLVWLGN